MVIFRIMNAGLSALCHCRRAGGKATRVAAGLSAFALANSNLVASNVPETVIKVDSSVTSGVTYMSWDTEGTGRETQNLLRPGAAVTVTLTTDGKEVPLSFSSGVDTGSSSGMSSGSMIFKSVGLPAVSWSVDHGNSGIGFTLSNGGGVSTGTKSFHVNFPFDPTVTPTTAIPSDWNDEQDVMLLPAIVSAPDFGQMILSSDTSGATARFTGSRIDKITNFQVDVPFPAAGTSVTLSLVPTRLDPPSAEIDPELWRLTRRGWFNLFQPSSRWRNPDDRKSAPLGMLSNNVISDPASFCVFMYADQALCQPELAPGISIMPTIRRTIEWWMDEKTSTSGECIGYWDYYNFLDSNPSLIIASWDYVEATGDREWLKGRIEKLEFLSSYLEGRNVDDDGMIEAVQTGNRNGLFEPDRSSCWWDAINCGHKDGYTNAVIYRAWRCLADLEKQLGRTEKEAKYTALADGIKASYAKVLTNPETEWLGWWRSKDGELHDYASPVVTGMAIEYGLIEPEQGRDMLRKLRAKIDEAGFTNFKLGVPCFLEPVNKSDYLQPHGLGCPQQEDGKDTFGQYMNGAVNASHVTHFLAAHYVSGDPEPADKILVEMLKHLNAGKFQHGVTDSIATGIDWADWEGKPTGYEGYLSDSFRFVQVVLLRHEGYRARLYRPLYTPPLQGGM